MNNLDQLFSKSNSPQEFAGEYLEYLSNLLQKVDKEQIGNFISLLLQARSEERSVYFIGNGGSAATSSHFANDLAVGTRTKLKPFRVSSLTDNNSLMTALANDDGFENVFLRQLEVYLKPQDILVAISASGNSPNLLRAIEYAKSKNCTVVTLTGFDGGKMKTMGDIQIHLQTPKGEYGPVEDFHMIVDHLIGSYLNREVKKIEGTTS